MKIKVAIVRLADEIEARGRWGSTSCWMHDWGLRRQLVNGPTRCTIDLADTMCGHCNSSS